LNYSAYKDELKGVSMEGRRRVSISLPDVLSKKMDAATEGSGLSASEIVRAALNEYFKKGE